MRYLFVAAIVLIFTATAVLSSASVAAISQNPNIFLSAVDSKTNLNFNQNKAPGELSIETQQVQPTFSGTAIAGVIITVTEGNANVLCTATAKNDKFWECKTAKALFPGDYKITVSGKFPGSTDSFSLPYFNLKITTQTVTVTEETTPEVTATPTQTATPTITVLTEQSSTLNMPLIITAVIGVIALVGIGLFLSFRKR